MAEGARGLRKPGLAWSHAPECPCSSQGRASHAARGAARPGRPKKGPKSHRARAQYSYRGAYCSRPNGRFKPPGFGQIGGVGSGPMGTQGTPARAKELPKAIGMPFAPAPGSGSVPSSGVATTGPHIPTPVPRRGCENGPQRGQLFHGHSFTISA